MYGAIHQFGGAEVGMAIPPRPYLGLSITDLDSVNRIIDRWALVNFGAAP